MAGILALKTTKTQRTQRLGSVIHLFYFFFYSSGYKQVSCYCQAFVLFLSLWFSAFSHCDLCAFVVLLERRADHWQINVLLDDNGSAILDGSVLCSRNFVIQPGNGATGIKLDDCGIRNPQSIYPTCWKGYL
jgi:hypothetical protein